MAVLTKEEFMKRINERIGEDNSDEAIAFMEDMTDTYDDMSNKLSDTTDWKQKYEENDTAWRNKYRERFSSPSENDGHEGTGNQDEPPVPMTYEELFTKEG